MLFCLSFYFALIPKKQMILQASFLLLYTFDGIDCSFGFEEP